MSAGWWRGEVAELEPEDVDALEQHQVERDARDGAGGVAHGHEAAAVVQRRAGPARPGRRRPGRSRRRRRPGRASRRAWRRSPARWSISRLAPQASAACELLGRRGDRRDRRAQGRTELHGGGADAAAGAEHDELLARLQRRPPSAARGTPSCRRRRRRPPRGRPPRRGSASARRRRRRPPRRRRRRSTSRRRGRRRASPSTPSPTSVTTPANSLPGMKGRGAGHLVRVGDHQHVGEVDRADVDPDPDLARRRARAAGRRRPRRPRARRSVRARRSAHVSVGARRQHRRSRSTRPGRPPPASGRARRAPKACSFSSSPARWKPCSSTTASFHLASTQ